MYFSNSWETAEKLGNYSIPLLLALAIVVILVVGLIYVFRGVCSITKCKDQGRGVYTMHNHKEHPTETTQLL